MENYFWNNQDSTKTKKVYVLVIYDIVDNRKRGKLADFLNGYGDRIQKSAFEMHISEKKYQALLNELPKYMTPSEDSIRVYKIIGNGEVTVFGINNAKSYDDVIII